MHPYSRFSILCLFCLDLVSFWFLILHSLLSFLIPLWVCMHAQLPEDDQMSNPELSSSPRGNSDDFTSRPSDQPVWIPDSSSRQCGDCAAAFTWHRRRHHCRACGSIFCAHCTTHASQIPHLGYYSRVRVCKTCSSQLQPGQESGYLRSL